MGSAKASAISCVVSFCVGAWLGFAAAFVLRDRSFASGDVSDDKMRAMAESATRGHPTIHVFNDAGISRSVKMPDTAAAAAVHDLILSLIPHSRGRKQILRHPNYDIIYQTGNSPCVIYVRMRHSTLPIPPILEFEIAGWLYRCEDGTAFERRINEVLEAERTGSQESTQAPGQRQ